MGFVGNVGATPLNEDIKFYNGFYNELPNNEYLQSITKQHSENQKNNKIELLEKDKEEKVKLIKVIYPKLNINSISIRAKFEIADALDIYKTVYNILCGEAHNDINSFTIESGNKIELFKPLQHYDYNLYCQILSSFLTASTEAINNLLELKEDENLKNMNILLEKNREIFKKCSEA